MISVEMKQFRQAAQLAGQCVERRNTIPVLGALRARANGKLELSGTDLDMTVDVRVPCDKATSENHEFMLQNFRFLVKAVAAAGGSQVQLAPTADALGVVAGELAINIKPDIKLDDWPTHCGAVVAEEFAARLSAKHLRQIDRVRAAISAEETRYYLNGVYLHHVQDWTWRAVATDGHRLMVAELQLPDASGTLPAINRKTDWGKGVIIPRKAMRLALDALAKCDEVDFRAGRVTARNTIESTAPDRAGMPCVSFAGALKGMDYQLSTKCIDGTFPDYRKVIPTENPVGVTLKIARLRQAIEAVAHITDTRTPAIKLSFDKRGVVVGNVFGHGSISANFRVPADHNAPDGLTVGLNSQYLKDCLAALRGENVFLGMVDRACPILIRDPEDTEFFSVLMPMRV